MLCKKKGFKPAAPVLRIDSNQCHAQSYCPPSCIFSSLWVEQKQIVIISKEKEKSLPTTMQASMVMAQARMTGKTVSFAKY